MQVSQSSVMTFKSYKYKAKFLVRDYLLADSFTPYTSVISGIFMSKMVGMTFYFLSSENCVGFSFVNYEYGLKLLM